MKKQLTITHKVLKNTIASMLADGKPSLSNLALTLDTSARTLQRRITDMDITYTHLLDEARCDKACKLLQNSPFKIHEIATLLGYADAGSFSRAFERWMGLSPRQFRNNY